MPEEAVTTLRAELGSFERAEEAFALLETFLEVAQPRIGSAVLDPSRLQLPDEMTDDRSVVRELIDAMPAAEPKRAWYSAVPEREYDLRDEQARWDYTRLAYCSRLATVWSKGRRTTYFEVADQTTATYWLPDSLKALYFDSISAKGWEIPPDWLAAVPKYKKPWWKRF
ncbi:hypothetical protein EV138_4431 [Kribbella voronezhensis]|uniref:Uncharacterized protein n=1 Tax=Kribbella voronezhensis TaxID=2512212 RepID=A0A4R7TF35_9ACTN|nr:hypothetical protein [Kribbella voronezhensis]TDU90831.1 hypothetical protein EV138_4431 [Kribbella voronezhensis]